MEPGPWSNCALFSLQAPTEGQAWNAQEREVWGVSMRLRGHCRKSLHPTPCPGIQFRTLWELEGTGTLNSTPPLSSLLGVLIKAPFINAGNNFLSAKERYLSLMLHSLRIFCIPCSLNVIRFSPLQLNVNQKDKDLGLSLHSPGSVPWWSPCTRCWFIEFSLLASNTQIFSCGSVFLRHFP